MVEKSHAFSRSVPEKFERDMGYSEKEFFRVLPAAIGDYRYSRNGHQIDITHPDHPHHLRITLSELPDRQLGVFRIQRMGVQFEFSNMTANARLQFMQRFDRRFQRGGG